MGVGTRFRYDGETVEVIEMAITATGNEVALKDHHGRVMRLAVKELLQSVRAQVIPDSPGPSSDDDEGLAGVVLAQLSHGQRDALLERAAHIREVLTGYRSGSPEMAEEGEPRPQYAARLGTVCRDNNDVETDGSGGCRRQGPGSSPKAASSAGMPSRSKPSTTGAPSTPRMRRPLRWGCRRQ